MSNYTEDDLRNMSRVQLRRAAITELGMDNKEASNTKSGLLIEQILAAGEGGSNGDKKKATKKTTAKKTAAKKDSTRTQKAAAADEAPAPTNGVGKLVDAVGKAVDETKSEVLDALGSNANEVSEGLHHIMKQQYVLFGLIQDIYKAVEEPDGLDARIEELGEEWGSLGNE